MNYFAILLVLAGTIIAPTIPSIYATPEPMPEDSFRFSDHVLTGKVVSSKVIPNPNEDTPQKKYLDTVVYEIQVLEWHKNPLDNNIITVYGDHYPNDVEPEPMWGVVEFEIGSIVYLYLDKTEDGLHFRSHSSYMVQTTEPDTYWGIVTEYPESSSPLKQFKAEIPYHEIKCKHNLQLTQRYDGSPACVKSETVFELIKRGWVSDIIVAVQSRDVFLEQDATSSYMEKIIPTLEDFKLTLSESYDINTIFSKFGEPHKDIGSGIHIYVYELNDDTEVWIGYVEDIWYVKHVDSNGNVLEELFEKNEHNTVTEWFKNNPEVKAFHMQYQDAQISMRDDHISYFSGSDDGYLVRMNLFFDENFVLENIDFHCYYKRVHQFEMPQDNLASKISKFDCKEYAESKNEN